MKPWLGRLAITMLMVLLAGSWACDDFSFDTGRERSDQGEQYQGPRGRTAIGADVRCFDTFGQFKRAMEKEGKKKLEYQWHHIGFYNRKNPRWGNLSLRDFLKPMTFEDQYVNGCRVLKEQNVEHTESVCL